VAEEYLAAHRRNFEKLDTDHKGALSFQEYAGEGDRQVQFGPMGGAGCRRRNGRYTATSETQGRVQL
jgi:hypothetical protein